VPIDPWLPVGLALHEGQRIRLPSAEGADWQIVDLEAGGSALIVRGDLLRRWESSQLVERAAWGVIPYGLESFYSYASGRDKLLAPVVGCRSPNNKAETIAFAKSLRATRAIDPAGPLSDALYVEAISRLLPTYTTAGAVSDELLLGTWLTGGVPIATSSFQRLATFLSWLGRSNLNEVIREAGLSVNDAGAAQDSASGSTETTERSFSLAGRADLEGFFREHVIDIVENQTRYRLLGIEFPGAIILHGPPGCGKTYAVQQLVDYLGWPSFAVDAASIGSPYIHETSRKVAAVFEVAMKNAPSVLVIDEMEAFLADREQGAETSHHLVEEVAEFLRRIPEAVKSHVLIIGMTNRMEMIDAAVQRRGRFDHVIHVGMPTAEEVAALLAHLTATIPKASDLQLGAFSTRLAGRPLSDVAFIVREGARLAARAGKQVLDTESLETALQKAPVRTGEPEKRKIGFV
jgi:hypothetical protein